MRTTSSQSSPTKARARCTLWSSAKRSPGSPRSGEPAMTEQIDEMFTRAVEEMRGLETTSVGSLNEAEADPRQLEVFDAQLGSRHLDLAARWLRSQGKGYYTIGSSGHEGNAAVAAALRPTDPALLHYRSGAFFLE